MINYQFKINLQGEREQHENLVFTTGDKNGYRLQFSFYSNGKKIDTSLYGLTVKAKRSDGAVIIDSGITTKDGAYYDVADNAYSLKGNLEFEVALVKPDGSYATTQVISARVREGFGENGLESEDNEPVLARLEGQYLECRAAENANSKGISALGERILANEEAIKANKESIDKNKTDIAENEKTSRNIFSNALYGKKLGPSVCIDDFSGLEHNLVLKAKSKNLFFVRPNPTAPDAAMRELNKNGVVITAEVGSSKLKINGHPTQNTSIDSLFEVTLEPGTYTISVTGSLGNDYIYTQNKTTGETYINTTSAIPRTFTISEKSVVSGGLVVRTDTATVYENTEVKVQIEENTTATEWVSYVSPADKAITVCGKNIIPFPYYNGAGTYGGVTVTINDNGVITLNGTVNEEGFDFYIMDPHKKYYWVNDRLTFSGISNGSKDTYGMTVYYGDGNSVGRALYNGSVTFEVNGAIKGISISAEEGYTFKNLQIKPMLELGEKASVYEKFNGAEYLTDEDGVIDGLKNLSKTMTFLSHDNYVLSRCEYVRDINKAFKELTNAIIALGGNV